MLNAAASPAWPGIAPAFVREGFDEFEAGYDDYRRWQRDALSPDLERAEQHLRRAAEQGEPLAYPYLGEIALSGNRQVEATRWFRQADAADVDTDDHSTSSQLRRLKPAILARAEAGDAEAQCEVAEWFCEGHGVPRDGAKGTIWLEKAAQQGFPSALYRLAVMYENGDGVAPDPATALSLHHRAAEAGQRDAQYRLAHFYREGGPLPKDEAKADQWIEQAAAQGHLQAIVELADAKMDVDDFAGAAPLLERAAVRGHPRSQCLLSWRYKSGEGVPRDERQALQWVQRSAQQGDIWAACDLGQRYRDGEGIERDEARAVRWLRRAAVNGDDDARRDLANLLAQEHRSVPELQEAAYWSLRDAIDRSRFDAEYAFGRVCELGRGAAQSDELAMKWYLLAAERGHPEARGRVSALCQEGRGFRSDDWLECVEVLSRATRAGAASAAEAFERLKSRDPRATAYSELLDLIGMAEVKDTVRKLVAMVTVDQMRRTRGLRVPATSLHCVFSGPPGTGKTTVARIIGKLLGALGILSNGHLKEVDRAGLVGRYVGETAQKVEDVVQEALGGVLFIDEAYSLSRSDNPSDYGHEAIDALVKRMEDHRSNLVVIVAGYGDEMDTFLQSNTGLESRFPWRFRFPHYSAAELLQVLQHLADKDGMRLDAAFLRAVHTTLAKHAGRDRSFGNGRFVRTLYEKARFQQAQRLLRQTRPTNDQLQTLLPDDLPLDRG